MEAKIFPPLWLSFETSSSTKHFSDVASPWDLSTRVACVFRVFCLGFDSLRVFGVSGRVVVSVGLKMARWTHDKLLGGKSKGKMPWSWRGCFASWETRLDAWGMARGDETWCCVGRLGRRRGWGESVGEAAR